MKTININGKKYTKKEFWKHAEEHDTGRCLHGENYGYIEFLSEIFQELKSDFPRHEPEPPTVRPMSELPEGDNQVLFVVSHQKKGTWNYGIGSPFQLEAISVNNQSYFKNKDYSAKWSSTKLIGWLPSLPNPNDIKL